MPMKTIVHVMGARPNYMKIAPLMAALRERSGFRQLLVNTGQHYDDSMSGVFIRELNLPVPDRNLEVGSASHAIQTARVMMKFEDVCLADHPDLVSVVGDVNSTVAAALVAAKLCIPIAHVEAGLRSFDRTMPEEINRLVTDQLADLLLTPSTDADDNLRREGIPASRIHCVGNIMIDTLLAHLPAAPFDRVSSRFPIHARGYAVVTLHRPSNVDDEATLLALLTCIGELASRMPVVFPVHPRTRHKIERNSPIPGLLAIEPLGYLDFLALTSNARLVITDSGGLQEETTALGIPCVTVRENTERPITVTLGTNRIVGTHPDRVRAGIAEALAWSGKAQRPELWDGHTAGRIADVYEAFLRS